MNKKFSFYLFNAFLDFKSKCKYLQVDLVTLKIEKVCEIKQRIKRRMCRNHVTLK